MKQSIWVLAVLFIACQNSNSSTSTPVEGSQIPAGAILQDYESIPNLQKAVIKSGDITLGEGDFLDGLYHGSWTTYDPEGKVQSITTYYKGKKQGVELIFDNLGYVQTKAYYHEDQLNGEYLVYNRRKITERRNYAGGQLEGLKQKFYTDGTVMEESNYVNGTIHGVAKWYDQEGNLKIEYEYNMGELVEK
ncbi:toxin-antitoxin system YwqK family antitoxin [Ekhidna sp.]|uniref:toxin-antitoxin system YwqK family antitoxin n=1 Tax=Ekhidna sp. TaxID=2608089 RepID=UPI003CCBAB9D